MEMFDSQRRAFAGIGLEAFWVFDYILLGGLAYWIRNWRHLQLVISLAILPAAFVAIWWVKSYTLFLTNYFVVLFTHIIYSVKLLHIYYIERYGAPAVPCGK